MSRERLAAAYEELAAQHASLAETYAQVALELQGSVEQPETRPAAAAAAPSTAVADTPDKGVCPKHGVPWESGQFGPFCKQMTDDPAWGKAKTDRDGNPVLWCKLTPRNAPDYLRIRAAA